MAIKESLFRDFVYLIVKHSINNSILKKPKIHNFLVKFLQALVIVMFKFSTHFDS